MILVPIMAIRPDGETSYLETTGEGEDKEPFTEAKIPSGSIDSKSASLVNRLESTSNEVMALKKRISSLQMELFGSSDFPNPPQDNAASNSNASEVAPVKSRVGLLEAEMSTLKAKLDPLENQVAGTTFDAKFASLTAPQVGSSFKSRIESLEE